MSSSLTCFHYADSLQVSHIEFATVDPLPSKDVSPVSWKHATCIERGEYCHKRWIALRWDDILKLEAGAEETRLERCLLKRLKLKKFLICKCTDRCSSVCSCKEFEDGCLPQCSCRMEAETCHSKPSLSRAVDDLEKRAASIRASGEGCLSNIVVSEQNLG